MRSSAIDSARSWSTPSVMSTTAQALAAVSASRRRTSRVRSRFPPADRPELYGFRGRGGLPRALRRFADLKEDDRPAERGGVWGRLVTRVLARLCMGRRRRRLTYGERQLIEGRTTALLRDPRALGLVAVVTVGCCLAEVFLLPGAPEYRGFLAGALAANVVWMVKLRLWQATWRETRGVEGEARSAELLSAVPQWLVVNDLFVQGRNV